MMHEAPAPPFSSNHRWWVYLLIAGLIGALDQAVKYAVVATMPYRASYEITSFFNLVHVWNTGAAFSFLADAGGWQRYFFIAIGIAVPAVLAWLLRRGVANWMEALAYSLIIGGALGNVIDRIVLGFVVDYLDFHWRGWHWPAFNAADMAITGGAILMVASSFCTASVPSGNSMKRREN
jgi:signal peptidase II